MLLLILIYDMYGILFNYVEHVSFLDKYITYHPIIWVQRIKVLPKI